MEVFDPLRDEGRRRDNDSRSIQLLTKVEGSQEGYDLDCKVCEF